MKYKLPAGWKEVELGEVTEEIFSGGTPRTKEQSFWNGNYNWLSSGETRLKYINKTEKSITLKGIQESSTKEALKGDIVMATAGQGKTRGQTSFLLINTYINQSIISLRANNDYIYNKFLFLNLSSRYSELRAISDSHSIRGSITTKMLKRFPIKLPVIKEQKSIADTLSYLDDKIELNNEINGNLEKQAQAIFKHWFINFEFPDGNRNPYKSSGGEMIESELGIIPKEWKVIKLEEKLSFIKGKVPKYIDPLKKDSYPYLSKAILDGNWDDVKYGLLESGIYCSQLDILMLMDGASSSEVFYGNDGLVGSTLSLIDGEDDNIREILYMYFSVFNDELKNQNTGSAIPHANKAYINNIKIAIPESQSKFEVLAETFKLIRVKILSNQQQNQKLSQLRDTLLPKLMSGEIRIPLD